MIFYAGVPLVSDDGIPLGTICVIDSSPKSLDHSQVNTLRALGRQVMNLLNHRKTKLTLAASEKRYRELFEKSANAELILNDGVFVECNAATILMLEYEGSALFLNKTPCDLSPQRQSDGRLSEEKSMEMNRIAHQKGSNRFEWNYLKAGGEVFPVEVLLTSIPGAHSQEQILHVVWRDISENKRKERELMSAELQSRALLEGSPVCNKIIDLQGRLVYMSKAGREELKITDIEDFYGRAYPSPNYPEKIRAPLVSSLNEALRGRNSKVECPLYSTEGEKIWYETTFVPVLNDTQEMLYVIATSVNITDRKKAKFQQELLNKNLEENVKKRTKELMNSEIKLRDSLCKEKELGKLKSSFVTTASHQFRTPLAVIQSNAELLEMFSKDLINHPPLNYQRATDRIKSAITKMTDLMDEVLILGKITSGHLDCNPEVLNLMIFCQDLAKQFNDIQTEGRVMETSQNGLPYLLHLDPKLLTHALSNLISNAFKYSEGEANPQLSISFRSKEVLLSIKDFGIGIPKDQMPHLFQPFFRAKNVTDINGTGLGLSIAREYIELNHGQIEVSSELGHGSCFEVKFFRSV